MKSIYIAIFVSVLSIYSCSKEDEITPTSQNVASKYDFPENTKYDDLTISIYEKIGAQVFWTKVKSSDMNKDWTTSELIGAKRCRVVNEQQAGESIIFLNDYIFSKIDPIFFNKVLKPYIYIVDDLHQSVGGSLQQPLNFNLKGMDCWAFSFYGEGASKYPSYPTDINFMPKTDAEIFKFRNRIFFELFNAMVTDKIIKAPTMFETDFDYITKLKYKKVDSKHDDFFMNRGFCGKVNIHYGRIGALLSTPLKPNENFVTYMALVATYSRNEIINGTAYPIYTDESIVPYSTYSKVLKYYDFVHEYILNNYGYDLNQLNSLK